MLFRSGADDYYSYVEDGGDRHRFMATALHEAIHVLGFTSGDCLGNCVPERVSHVDHTSKFKFFWDGAELVQYETLSLDEKEVVHRSQDDFLFIGTQATQDVASNELVDGFSHGGLELHAEVESDGRVDPQNGAHFSPQMEPAQLMHSAGANVLDLGMAAYYLCDVGWCRDGGQVIDVGVATAVSEGVVENETFTVDYVLSGDQNIAIPSATFEFSVDDGLVVQSVLDPDGICQQSGNTFQCERFSFDIGEQYEVSLTLSGPVGDYKIEGGVKSNAYDVDRRPFSNVVDTFITVAEEVVAPPPPPQAEPPMVTPEAPSSSGGSMGVGILALLSMVFVRRFTK